MNRTWRRLSSKSSGTRFAMGPSTFYSLTTVSNLAVLKANRDYINMPRMDGLSLLQKLARNGVATQFDRW
jgi:hypothetical protein